jgi:hypothetical protein
MYTQFQLENSEGTTSGDQDADRRIILKWFLKKYFVIVQTGFNEPRTGSDGDL